MFDRFENGYFSIIHSKKSSIPESNLHVIEADLKRMDISSEEYDQVFSVLVVSYLSLNQISIYLHDQEMGYVQGMHNIVYRLLQLFTEEETFYIFLGVLFLLSCYQ